jgi:hypothetical protein
MDRASPCRICGEHAHSSSACGNLRDVLKEGFFSGGGGGGGDHDHDEDDSLSHKKDYYFLFFSFLLNGLF